jgi:ATP-dependent DNA helicase RecG
MAPTQILAEQHALNLRRQLEPLGVRVDLFSGNTKNKKGERLQGGELDLFAAKGEPSRRRATASGSIVVGTHALLYDRYAADQLGLIVIDEQHKFGVLQRLALSRKGQNPDILVMTATPIPRTLGMTVYGDLDVSVLDELPPGRQPILTKRKTPAELEQFWAFLRQKLRAGRQAYIVYPLVEESEKVDAKSVKAEFERLKTILPDVRRRGDPGAGLDVGHRGGRRCAECDDHADRERGAFWAGATASVARTRRSRRARVVLRAGGRTQEQGGLAAAEDHGGDDRRIPDRRGGL